MAYVITPRCVGVKDAACVIVCPMDCIHPTKDETEFISAKQLYIDPDSCIDCGLCQHECPVKAIFPEEDLPKEFRETAKANADYFGRSST